MPRQKKYALATKRSEIVFVNKLPKVFMVQEQPKYFMSELIVFLALEKPKLRRYNIKDGFRGKDSSIL